MELTLNSIQERTSYFKLYKWLFVIVFINLIAAILKEGKEFFIYAFSLQLIALIFFIVFERKEIAKETNQVLKKLISNDMFEHTHTHKEKLTKNELEVLDTIHGHKLEIKIPKFRRGKIYININKILKKHKNVNSVIFKTKKHTNKSNKILSVIEIEQIIYDKYNNILNSESIFYLQTYERIIRLYKTT